MVVAAAGSWILLWWDAAAADLGCGSEFRATVSAAEEREVAAGSGSVPARTHRKPRRRQRLGRPQRQARRRRTKARAAGAVAVAGTAEVWLARR